ncbi:hypothetical protein LSM04_002083 [Trypanosoma melophagium]|uniref:uncharacterized protein n=1 Tax=Trypanosoma melophagium TaxID=715481 RepID=UPI003519DF32|nr:hypothetical protein LSM04_002083 [Trypanosoma melophagium]
MQHSRQLCRVFPHYPSTLCIRRGSFVTNATAVVVLRYPYHTAVYTSKRYESHIYSKDIPERSEKSGSFVSPSSSVSNNTGNTVKEESTTTATATTTMNKVWDDATVVAEIKDVLHTLLTCKEEEGSYDINSKTVVTLHSLFRSLGPTLRYRLQNSSFGALLKALKSRPDWFILNAEGTTVRLTQAAGKEKNPYDVNSNTNTISSSSSALSSSTTTTSTTNNTTNDTSGRRNFKTAAITTTNSCVLIRGTLAVTPLDVSRPPVTADEVEKWRLTRLLLPLALPFLLPREPITLFPRGPRPPPLAAELEEAEELYRSKGFFPLSEIAAAFVPITPTFFVETRHVLNAMSPDVAQCFERHVSRDHIVDSFFKKYPMIFKLKVAKFQKASVKLNLEFAFIRHYPGCGRADRLLRRYNQEYRPTVGGVLSRAVPSSSSTAPSLSSSTSNEEEALNEKGENMVKTPIDVKIFEILVRNLPRVATDPLLSQEELEEKRCQSFSLVEWIHGFSQEDLEVLNSVPQQRTLTILTRYTRIFQLMCSGEDSNIFAKHKYLKVGKNINNNMQRPSSEKESTSVSDASLNSMEVDSETLIDEKGIKNTVLSQNEKDKENKNKEEGLKTQSSENVLGGSTTDLEHREANLAAALRDDLIGMDDFLNDTAASTSPPLDGDTNTEMDESTEKQKEMDGEGEGEEEEEEEEYDDAICHDLENEEMRTSTTKRITTTSTTPIPTPVHEEQSTFEDDSNGLYIPSRYDILYLRRLPKRIAARSLSDYNSLTSPEPELLRYISSFLNPPPSLWDNSSLKQRGGEGGDVLFSRKPSTGQWRWVPVQRIYASLNKEQKRLLRPYKGLVHFMRLHGEVFELSADFLHVIAHDPQGRIPPFVPTQTTFFSEDRVLLPSTLDDDKNSKASLIGDAERKKFEGILGASQIPTDRRQLILLDPLNPLLNHEILCEEVSFFMPDHPVSIHQLMSRLPPILRAALSVRHKNNFKTSKHLTVWIDNNRMMLQRSQLALPESAKNDEEELPVEDAIECIREVVPDEGVMISHLNRMLPGIAKKTLKQHFGNVYNALLGYPQYFYIEKAEEGNRYNSVLYLVERLQEER